ncbi:MAG: hypothetical protein HC849_02315 [Oscillatoriales cyanobacterium RU_3_3]|nr:hypothetical protein [Oscillatoriales cyanobacterium RU_3_3]
MTRAVRREEKSKIRRFPGKSLPLASTPLSQLETRYCSLSGAEGSNIGANGKVFARKHLSFSGRLVSSKGNFMFKEVSSSEPKNIVLLAIEQDYKCKKPSLPDNIFKWLNRAKVQRDTRVARIKHLIQKCSFNNEEQVFDFLKESKCRISLLESIVEKIRDFFPEEEIVISYISGNEYVDGGLLVVSVQTYQTYQEASKPFGEFEESWWNAQWIKSEKNILVRLDFFEYV